MAKVDGADGKDARNNLQTVIGGLDEARRLAATVDAAAGRAALSRVAEDNAVWVILGLTAAFVLISTAVILFLAAHVRRSFYEGAAGETEGNWRNYLMQLPLGVPEGSVRALLSMYVVIFGLLVLVMQKRLNLPSVEAIAGFVGIVITFYFTSRSNDQAQKAADESRKAVGAAVQAVTEATTAAKAIGVASQAQSGLQAVAKLSERLDDIKDSILKAQPGTEADATAAPGSAGAAAPTGTGKLRELQADLQLTRQILGALRELGVGSQLIPDADALAAKADTVLGTIDGAVQGGAGGPELAQLAATAEQLRGTLGEVGVPGMLGGAMSVIASVTTATASAPAGLAAGPVGLVAAGPVGLVAGGPVGLVAGLVTSGLQLLADKARFETWKTAVLARPFDPALLLPPVDASAARIALDLSPLMSSRLEGAPPNVATELLQAAIQPGADGNPPPIADLAHEVFTGADPLGLKTRFASEAELVEALQEYRTSLFFTRARDALSGQVGIPALAGNPAASISLGALLDSAFSLRQDPRAGSALEKIVYLVQALGLLHLDPARLAALVQSGLAAGAAMMGNSRTLEDRRT